MISQSKSKNDCLLYTDIVFQYNYVHKVSMFDNFTLFLSCKTRLYRQNVCHLQQIDFFKIKFKADSVYNYMQQAQLLEDTPTPPPSFPHPPPTSFQTPGTLLLFISKLYNYGIFLIQFIPVHSIAQNYMIQTFVKKNKNHSPSIYNTAYYIQKGYAFFSSKFLIYVFLCNECIIIFRDKKG